MKTFNCHRQKRDQSRSLAVAFFRDRIGRDLHDGVIQSIYAAGLTLEDIASRADKEPQEVRPRIDSVVGDLNQAIADIRSYIMDLRPRELQGGRLDEVPAPRPPFLSKIMKLHQISDFFGKSLNHVEIPMNSEIFLFLMKKALSKRLIFLRKYWCFCSAGRQKAGKS